MKIGWPTEVLYKAPIFEKENYWPLIVHLNTVCQLPMVIISLGGLIASYTINIRIDFHHSLVSFGDQKHKNIA